MSDKAETIWTLIVVVLCAAWVSFCIWGIVNGNYERAICEHEGFEQEHTVEYNTVFDRKDNEFMCYTIDFDNQTAEFLLIEGD
jgi:hypothetical protein